MGLVGPTFLTTKPDVRPAVTSIGTLHSNEWVKARKEFLEALQDYIQQCLNCGAYILTEDECDVVDEEGISGEGALQLKLLAIRSPKRPDRCLYCEDI